MSRYRLSRFTVFALILWLVSNLGCVVYLRHFENKTEAKQLWFSSSEQIAYHFISFYRVHIIIASALLLHVCALASNGALGAFYCAGAMVMACLTCVAYMFYLYTRYGVTGRTPANGFDGRTNPGFRMVEAAGYLKAQSLVTVISAALAGVAKYGFYP